MTTPILSGDMWCVNFNSADLTACEEVKAAVAGQSHYIHYLVVFLLSTTTFTLGAGETTPGAPDTKILGAVPFSSSGGSPLIVDLRDNPIILTAGKSLVALTTNAVSITILVIGKTA